MSTPKAFPIYIIRERRTPTCLRDDCDRQDQPEHWVSVDLSAEVRAIIHQAGVYLAGEKNRHAQRISRKLATILANAKEAAS